jgi:4-phytase/acid phosphatase
LRLVSIVACAFLAGGAVTGAAQTASAATPSAVPELRMVVVLSRHGVRSPSHPDELHAYAKQPWPAWPGKPGNLTARGAVLMRQFGRWYRQQYGEMLGMPPANCPRRSDVFVWADVDQRTRASAEAFAGGFAPGCGIVAQHAATDNDTLFDPLPGVGVVDKAESRAAVLGTVGGGFDGIAGAYASAFTTMETVLGCASASACKQISRVPTTLSNDGDGGLASIDGGLDMAADVGENLLLEYTNGNAVVGWGRVDHQRLLQLLALHVFAKRLEHGNVYTARAHSSNIMAHVLATLAQGAGAQAGSGTRVPPDTRFVFLSGHDTQLAEISGMLHLSWLVPGDQLDDTPPGGALIFELHSRNGAAFVRTFYAQQSLDAMRAGHGEHPLRVPVYVPGCPGYDCPFTTFAGIAGAAIDPAFVTSW